MKNKVNTVRVKYADFISAKKVLPAIPMILGGKTVILITGVPPDKAMELINEGFTIEENPQ